MNCEVCERPINVRTDSHYQFVTGWAKSRSAGGTNAIHQREPQERYRCNTCVAKLSELEGQEALF